MTSPRRARPLVSDTMVQVSVECKSREAKGNLRLRGCWKTVPQPLSIGHFGRGQKKRDKTSKLSMSEISERCW